VALKQLIERYKQKCELYEKSEETQNIVFIASRVGSKTIDIILRMIAKTILVFPIPADASHSNVYSMLLYLQKQFMEPVKTISLVFA